MIAYKFLTAEGAGPFTGHRWPLPADDGGGAGAWVEAPADPCRSGVHACRVRDLPFWIGRNTLFAVELDGDLVEHRSKGVAARGRLVRRIDAWDDAAYGEYTRACADRVHELAAGAGGRMDAWAALVEPSLAEGPASSATCPPGSPRSSAAARRSGPSAPARATGSAAVCGSNRPAGAGAGRAPFGTVRACRSPPTRSGACSGPCRCSCS